MRPSTAAFLALPFEEQVDQIATGAIADIKAYGGKPAKLLRDLPHRDYSRFERQDQPNPARSAPRRAPSA